MIFFLHICPFDKINYEKKCLNLKVRPEFFFSLSCKCLSKRTLDECVKFGENKINVLSNYIYFPIVFRIIYLFSLIISVIMDAKCEFSRIMPEIVVSNNRFSSMYSPLSCHDCYNIYFYKKNLNKFTKNAALEDI